MEVHGQLRGWEKGLGRRRGLWLGDLRRGFILDWAPLRKQEKFYFPLIWLKILLSLRRRADFTEAIEITVTHVSRYFVFYKMTLSSVCPWENCQLVLFRLTLGWSQNDLVWCQCPLRFLNLQKENTNAWLRGAKYQSYFPISPSLCDRERNRGTDVSGTHQQ